MSVRSQEGLVPLQEIISSRSGSLGALLQRASELQRLQERLRAHVSPPLADHMTLANVDDRVMVIQTDSPSWAARLRFQTPELLRLAREKCNLPDIQTVRIKVQVSRREPEPAQRQFMLTAAAARTLNSSAQSISDPALRTSLLRLSRRT